MAGPRWGARPACGRRRAGRICGVLACSLGRIAFAGSIHGEWDKTNSTIARKALDRIGALHHIERVITGRSADSRLAARQKHCAPKVAAFFAWSGSQLALTPGKGDLAKAFRYGLNRKEAFSLFREDGRVAIDNPSSQLIVKKAYPLLRTPTPLSRQPGPTMIRRELPADRGAPETTCPRTTPPNAACAPSP